MPLTAPPSAPPAAPAAPGAAPSRSDPASFRALADAFVVWLVGFRNDLASLRTWLASYISWAGTHITEITALQDDVTTKQVVAANAASTAATSAAQTNTWRDDALAAKTAAESANTAAQNALSAFNTTGKAFTAAEGTTAGLAATTNDQRFAVLDASAQFFVIYKNASGVAVEVGRLYTKAYIDSIAAPISSLNALAGGGPSLMWGVKDTQDQIALGILNNGKAILDIDESSRAWAAINALGIMKALADDNAIYGSAHANGSPPSPLKTLYAISDSSGQTGFALLSDGTFWIGKYDANLQSVVDAHNPAEFFGVSSGQIVKLVGLAQTQLTTLGNNSLPRPIGTKVQFQSDRMRGLPAAYEMSRDGTGQRLVLGTQRSYEVVFVTGQSLATGETTTAITTTAPYPTSALMLGGPPVVTGPSTRAAGSLLVACKETTKETVSTSFAASLLDTELAQRATLKQVMLGNGFPGTAYTGIKRGTATYNDVLAQIAQVVAFGSTVVRAGIIVHGEADSTNASYDANLIEWQSDYETDIRATTGQKEPVFLLICQTASIRVGFAPGTTSHKSALAQHAASEASSKIILAVPQYILTYSPDQVHIDATSQRLMGEYVQKAYKAVCIEGRDWRGVAPRAYTVGATFIDIQFWVPVEPLVLDTALATDPGNYGFSYSDASGRTISSVALKAGTTDTVRIQLSGTVGANAVIDYAYSNGTLGFSGPTQGARGCLRDSDPAVSRFDATKHLYNPCAIFRKVLN